MPSKYVMRIQLFVREFLRNWKSVGALFPSSRFLATAMVDSIDLSRDCTVVELGPGTGPFTRKLLSRMTPGSKLIVYETNATFCRELARIKDPRLEIKQTSALDVRLLPHKVDYVVSGLALANFRPDDKAELMASVHTVLADDGVFVQFQYLPESYCLLRRLYERVDLGFTLFNLPPALVYRCYKDA